MKENIPQMTKLQKEKALAKENLKKTNDPDIKEFLQNIIDEPRKEPKSNIKVTFIALGITEKKEFYNRKAIDTYTQSIIELGVDKVKAYFPILFTRDSKTGKINNRLVSENTYLKATLSTADKKKHIEAIAEKLRVGLTVTIIKR